MDNQKDSVNNILHDLSLNDLRIAVDNNRDRIIIGLDFGTTYSGIAYAYSNKPEQVHTITEWPGAQGRSFQKTPTVLKYDAKNSFQWGYQLDRTVEEKIVGIKLLLDPDQERPLFDSAGAASTKAELKKLGKPPVDVASDYICAIYRHALTRIAGKLPKEYFSMLDKQFILSVPAVWSDKAKDTTMRAARNAGIAPLELIKEPEAAALFTFSQLKDQGLTVGDAITVCDAGGGTVDLVSYEIIKLDPMELKELVPSTGGIAGSLMINRRFEDFIKNTVGERTYLDLKETDAWRRAIKDFDEQVKPGFRGRDDEDQYINFPMANIPDAPDRGIKANTVTVSANDLYGIFEPVFKEIDRLIAEQINKVRIKRLEDHHPQGAKIKAVFLVGGFGSSIFLKEAIQKAHPDIQVIQPENAWSAIVQGAVLSKLPKQATVVSSVAERHYGVSGGEYWVASRDAGHEHWRYRDIWEDVDRISIMKWYITKGDDLARERSISFPFFSQLPKNPTKEQYINSWELSMCPSELAPEHPEVNLVQKCCQLEIDLSTVPQEHFVTKTKPTDGTSYLTLHYNLLLKIEGARMVFSFECNGEEYGTVSAEY